MGGVCVWVRQAGHWVGRQVRVVPGTDASGEEVKGLPALCVAVEERSMRFAHSTATRSLSPSPSHCDFPPPACRHESSLEEGSAAFFAIPADAAQTDAGGGEAAEAAAAAGMPATATLQERALSLRRHSRGPSWASAAAAAHSRHASFGAAAADQQQQHLEEGGAAAGAAAAAGRGAGVGEGGAGQQGRVDDALEAELAKHRADMDEEYLSMVGRGPAGGGRVRVEIVGVLVGVGGWVGG